MITENGKIVDLIDLTEENLPSQVEYKRVVKLGRESPIRDTDLPFNWLPTLKDEFQAAHLQELNDYQKGTIVEIAAKHDRTITEVLEHFGSMLGLPKQSYQ